MYPQRISEAGGTVLLVAGFVTIMYLLTDATFGFIVPILHLMNMAVGITALGLLALSKPRLAPLAGAGAIGIAVDTFVFMWHDPLWALPTVVGGLLCLASLLPGRVGLPKPQQQ